MLIEEIATRQQIDELKAGIEKMNRQFEELTKVIGNLGNTKPTKPIHNKTEAAKYLGVNISTVMRKIKEGVIRTNSLGQIPAEELERYCSAKKPKQNTKGVPPAFLFNL